MTAGLAGAAGAYVSGAGGTPSNQPQALDTGTIWGMALNYVSGTQVQIEAGRARNIADDFDIELTAAQTINLAANGANGLDTGSVAANTWYYAWAIGDSNGVNPGRGLGSLSTTVGGLTMPAGYDRARRVGAMRRGSSALLQFNQYVREGAARVICYDEIEIGSLQVLSGYGSLGYTTVNLGSFVPPVTVYPWLNMTSDSSSGTVPFVSIRPTGSTVAAPVQLARVFGEDSAFFWCRSNTSQQVDLNNSSGLNTTNLYVAGYRDHLLQ